MEPRHLIMHFCTEDDQVCKNDQFEEPRMLDYTKLDVRRYDDGYVAVELDDQTLAMMGNGPFRILLAAARHGATIEFEEVWKQETPYLVRRFFDMLKCDLKMVTNPVFNRDWARRLTIVGGMTSERPHMDSPEARRRRVAILAGEA